LNSYKQFKANTFSEIGIDPENNKYGIGISSEIEFEDGSEKRFKKWLAVDEIYWIYFRIWILKYVFGFSFNINEHRIKKEGKLVFWKQKKQRKNFKVLFGRAGFKKI
jgi:hypothetical protein